MRKKVTRIAAVVALAAVVAGSTSNVAFAHHGRSHRTVVQNPAPVCYADGSCDVDGVCTLGVACDGTVHHTATACYADGSCDVNGVCTLGVACDGTVHHTAATCYADGSCDVNGVCTLGVACDGTVHHTTSTYYYGGTGHHGGHHR